MKVAILADTHLGIKRDSNVMLDYQERFFQNLFFPYLKENSICNVIHVGDVFDRRQQINLNTLDRARTMLFDPLYSNGITMHAIVGNHDAYFLETNRVNALALTLNEYKEFFHLYEDPAEIELGGAKILLLPWITSSNKEQSLKRLNESKADVCFGHLEINGFEQSKGHACDKGFDQSVFSKFKLTGSGHFHLKGIQGNITYFGTAYEMTWEDYGTEKGFYVFDTDTFDLEYISNPEKIYTIITYDDSKEVVMPTNLENKYVKVLVDVKNDPKLYDDYIAAIEKQKPLNYVTINREVVSNIVSIDDVEIKGTETIFKEYINSLNNLTVKKEDIISEMMNLYMEASLVQ